MINFGSVGYKYFESNVEADFIPIMHSNPIEHFLKNVFPDRFNSIIFHFCENSFAENKERQTVDPFPLFFIRKKGTCPFWFIGQILAADLKGTSSSHYLQRVLGSAGTKGFHICV